MKKRMNKPFWSSLYILAIILSSFLPNSLAFGKVANSPFDTELENNPYEISKLTCYEYDELMKNRDRNLFPVIIWIHGLASGLDQKTTRFTSDQTIGLMGLTANLCKGRQDETIFNIYVKFHNKSTK